MSPVFKALIITVNYRNADSTLEFLESASRLRGFEKVRLIVVDNNSGDDSIDRLRRAASQFTNVEVLQSEVNSGYFGGAAWALRKYLDRCSLPGWVLVCNNDVVFDDSRFLLRLFEENPAAVGVIAPSVTSSLTGHDANPCIRNRPRWFRMLRYRLWLSNYYAAWFRQWASPYVRRARRELFHWSGIASPASRRSIYAPHGSFLIFSRKFFEAGGWIDDGSFLYAEEFCVAEMCLHLALPVIHEPALRVRHRENQTTGRMLTRSGYAHQKNGLRYALARYRNSYDGPVANAPVGKTTLVKGECEPHYSSAGESE